VDKNRTVEAISVGRDGPLDSCGKTVLNHRIFFAGHLQFVERKPLHTVLCSAAYGAATVAREPCRRLSMGGTTAPLR